MKHINFKLLNYPYTVLVDNVGPNPPPPEAFFMLTEDGQVMDTESSESMLLQQAPAP